MDKNIAVMAVLITAWAVTTCSYPIQKPYEYDFMITSDSYSSVQGTGSMQLTITPTSTLYLNVVKSMDDIKVNDIIYFVSKDSKNIVHRCIYKLKESCITKGDNNYIVDDFIVPIENIKYKVIAIKYY